MHYEIRYSKQHGGRRGNQVNIKQERKHYEGEMRVRMREKADEESVFNV